MDSRLFKFLFTSLILFCMNYSFSQTRIRIFTEEGISLKNATLKAWNPWGLEITVSQDSISFEFLISETCNRIRVSGFDFETVDTVFIPEIALNSVIELSVDSKATLLDEVSLSVSRLEPKIKHSSVSLTVIKPYLFENRNPTDAGQLLSIVPGVTIADNQINIRNGSGWSYGAGSRVMVMVDDLPMLSPDAQAAQLTFIPMELMQQMEVVKSAGSAVYGSSALNGVVHMRSRTATEKPWLRFSAFSGFFDHPSNDSMIWSTKKRWASGHYGAYSQKLKQLSVTAGYHLLDNAGYRMNEYEKRARISLRLSRVSKIHPQLQYGVNTSAQTGKSGSFLLWENYSRGTIPLDSGFNISVSGKLAIDPFLRFHGKRFKHLIQARFLMLDNQIDNGQPDNDQSNGSSMRYFEYRASTYLFNKAIGISGGATANNSETHSALFEGEQRSVNIAAFTEIQYQKKRFRINTGARLEHFKLNNTQFTRPVFRGGLNYTAAKATFLRFGFGQGYRFPSMAESFISTSAGPVHIYPNPNLQPESGFQMELGFKQGFRIGKFRGYTDLSLFRSDIQHLMEFTFSQWADFTAPLLGLGFKSVNTAAVRTQGIEAEIIGLGKIRLIDLKLITGYTYTDAQSLMPDAVFATDFSNNPLTFSNTRAENTLFLKYRYKHLFKADLQVSRKLYSAGLSMQYNSRMLNMDNAFAYNIEQFAPGIRHAWLSSGPAIVFDVRAGYQMSPSIKLQLMVLNLGNRIYLARPADIRPPRSFQLQISWQPYAG